jgi:DNA-binding transcriptional regulator YiaG
MIATMPPQDWTPKRIRNLRLRLDYTQAEMAQALGYEHARTVSDLENNRRRPSGSVAVLLDILEQHGDIRRKE